MTEKFAAEIAGYSILIHTSVKLVTACSSFMQWVYGILIHTSVKLVTCERDIHNIFAWILIHTSVKLVTSPYLISRVLTTYFNPHEREARDIHYQLSCYMRCILIHTSVKLVTQSETGQERLVLLF